MTPLGHLLIARIREGGPITVADYMAECLLHPVAWLLHHARSLRRGGRFHHRARDQPDVRRAARPCLAQAWLDQGAPAPFTLAELGPGRGTLMADVLRATRGVPGFHAAAQVALVEASPACARCRRQDPWHRQCPHWLDRVEDLPDQPLFLVANEFFDALPIRQFQRDARRLARTAGRADRRRAGLRPVATRCRRCPDTPAFRADPPRRSGRTSAPAAAAVAGRPAPGSRGMAGRRCSSTMAAGGRGATPCRPCAPTPMTTRWPTRARPT